MGLMALTMFLAPRTLIGFFLDMNAPGNQPVIALAVQFLAVAALFQIADGAQTISAGMLRGLRDTRVPILLAGVGYWVLGVPPARFSPLFFGPKALGVWFGLATGLPIFAILLSSDERVLGKGWSGTGRSRGPPRLKKKNQKK